MRLSEKRVWCKRFTGNRMEPPVFFVRQKRVDMLLKKKRTKSTDLQHITHSLCQLRLPHSLFLLRLPHQILPDPMALHSTLRRRAHQQI